MARRAKNEGTIYKKTVIRKGKEYTYWEAQVNVGTDPGSGKRIRKTFTGSTQKEVRQKMQEASVEINERTYFQSSNATLSDWINLWLKEYCNDVKYQTKKHYAAQCNTHIIPALGAIKLSKLTTEHIQAFYNDLSKTGKTVTRKNKKTGKVETVLSPLAPKSVKNIHAILSKCLNTAIRLKYIKYNPASITDRPKVLKAAIKPLSEDEVKEFLRRLESEELSDMYKTIIFTGIRESEAIGLSWKSVDLNKGIMRINQQLQKRPIRDGGFTIAPVKQDRERYLTLTQYVINTLSHRKAEQDADREAAGKSWYDFKEPNGKSAQLVFTDKLGNPITPKRVYLHFKKIAIEMGIGEERVHDLRHTYAVLSLQNGDDHKTLQENLGHASASFTLDVYGHTTNKMKQESASKLDHLIDTLSNPKSDEKHE